MWRCVDYWLNENNELVEIWNNDDNGEIKVFVNGEIIKGE